MASLLARHRAFVSGLQTHHRTRSVSQPMGGRAQTCSRPICRLVARADAQDDVKSVAARLVTEFPELYDTDLSEGEEDASNYLEAMQKSVEFAQSVVSSTDVEITPENIDAQIDAAFNADDVMVEMTEEEYELYQQFEADAKEVYGEIKDDLQLDTGIPTDVYFENVEAEADTVILEDEDGIEEEDEEEDVDDLVATAYEDEEDEDTEANNSYLDVLDDEDDLDRVETVLDIVEEINEKYAFTEQINDLAQLEEQEKLRGPDGSLPLPVYDEVDKFFDRYMPGLDGKEASYGAPEYKLNFLWLDANIAVSVDQVYSKGSKAPLTEYFFWPRKDAWDELRLSLEARPWIDERAKVILLNRTTEVINFWQDEESKHTPEEARERFPDCTFTAK